MEKPKLIEDLGMKRPKTSSRNSIRYGLFECPFCNKEFVTAFQSVKYYNTKSCGCIKIKKSKKENVYFNSKKHGKVNTSIYHIWASIKQRCNNKNNPSYKNYGGRGINMCQEWSDSFMSFYNWSINNGFNEGLEIDRKNNDIGYEPNNCRFISKSQNNQNTRLIRKNNTSGYRGVGKSANKWVSVIQHQKKLFYLGTFLTKEQAAIAYNNFIIKNKTSHPLNNVVKKTGDP